MAEKRGHSEGSKKKFGKRPRWFRKSKSNKNAQSKARDNQSKYVFSEGRFKRRGRLVSVFNPQQVHSQSLANTKKEISELKENKQDCQLCNRSIEDMLTALKDANSEGYCHFECVQKELLKSEELADSETLAYIGNGSFCIVQTRKNRGKPYYFFRKRIDWIKKEETEQD